MATLWKAPQLVILDKFEFKEFQELKVDEDVMETQSGKSGIYNLLKSGALFFFFVQPL